MMKILLSNILWLVSGVFYVVGGSLMVLAMLLLWISSQIDAHN